MAGLQRPRGSRWRVVLAGSLALPLVALGSSSVAAKAAPAWQVPVTATYAGGLPAGNPYGGFNDGSCTSGGNCTAVGVVRDVSNVYEAMHDDQVNGIWAAGAVATYAGGIKPKGAGFNAVSCSSPGNCTAVGSYWDAKQYSYMLVDDEVGGVWAGAVAVKFPAGVEYSSPYAQANAVSCSSPGNCTAVGSYWDTKGRSMAAAVRETNGVWANAVPIELADDVQSTVTTSNLTSISCKADGYCTTVGSFTAAGKTQAMSATMVAGTWETASPATFAPGLESLGSDRFENVTCVSKGNCTAVGFISDNRGQARAITATQKRGIWAGALVPSYASKLHIVSPWDRLDSVSCRSKGNCTAVGTFADAKGVRRALAMTEVAGHWGKVAALGGVSATAAVAQLNRVSCSSPGSCTAVGSFVDSSGGWHAMAATQTSGSWGGTVDLGTPPGPWQPTFGHLYAITCNAPGVCTAVGDFMENPQLFYRTLAISTPATAPGPPTSLVATPGNRQVTLTWAAPSFDGGRPVTSYLVYQGKKKLTATTATTYVVAKLPSGTKFSFKVVAVNAIGQGVASAPVKQAAS